MGWSLLNELNFKWSLLLSWILLTLRFWWVSISEKWIKKDRQESSLQNNFSEFQYQNLPVVVPACVVDYWCTLYKGQYNTHGWEPDPLIQIFPTSWMLFSLFLKWIITFKQKHYISFFFFGGGSHCFSIESPLNNFFFLYKYGFFQVKPPSNK